MKKVTETLSQNTAGNVNAEAIFSAFVDVINETHRNLDVIKQYVSAQLTETTYGNEIVDFRNAAKAIKSIQYDVRSAYKTIATVALDLSIRDKKLQLEQQNKHYREIFEQSVDEK